MKLMLLCCIRQRPRLQSPKNRLTVFIIKTTCAPVVPGNRGNLMDIVDLISDQEDDDVQEITEICVNE